MDFFNSKKLAALEARIAALEPSSKYADVVNRYVTTTSCGDDKPTLEALDKRLKEVEDEVMPERDYEAGSIYRLFFNPKPEKLTLRRKIERICEHLKIKFVTEPQRTVIKPVKKAKG